MFKIFYLTLTLLLAVGLYLKGYHDGKKGTVEEFDRSSEIEGQNFKQDHIQNVQKDLSHSNTPIKNKSPDIVDSRDQESLKAIHSLEPDDVEVIYSEDL